MNEIYVKLFNDLQVCPICGSDLKLDSDYVKACPRADMRFNLRINGMRWYIFFETAKPKSRIKIVETGEIFITQKEVADHILGFSSAVNECLKGKRKKHKGYSFEWVD